MHPSAHTLHSRKQNGSKAFSSKRFILNPYNAHSQCSRASLTVHCKNFRIKILLISSVLHSVILHTCLSSLVTKQGHGDALMPYFHTSIINTQTTDFCLAEEEKTREVTMHVSFMVLVAQNAKAMCIITGQWYWCGGTRASDTHHT